MAERTTPEEPDQPPLVDPTSPSNVPAALAVEKPPSRAMLLLSWVTAVIIAGFGGWIAMRAAEGSTPYRWGVAVGTVVTPFLISAGVRLVYVRLRGGRGGKAALRSPWVPLAGALLVGLAAAGDIASMAPPPPVEAETAMHVRTPFTLREADAATAQEIEQGMRDDPSVRSVAVREVVGGDGSVSVFMAADARLREDGISEVAKGMQDSSGLVPTIETIGRQEVAIVTGPDGAIGTWIEEPLLLSVFAPDLATLHAVIEAVIGSG